MPLTVRVDLEDRLAISHADVSTQALKAVWSWTTVWLSTNNLVKRFGLVLVRNQMARRQFATRLDREKTAFFARGRNP